MNVFVTLEFLKENFIFLEVENVQDSKTVSSAAEEKREEKMTDAQRARVERNRQKAILLKQARLANHPYGQDKDRLVIKQKIDIICTV